jgi:hypothetical protein
VSVEDFGVTRRPELLHLGVGRLDADEASEAHVPQTAGLSELAAATEQAFAGLRVVGAGMDLHTYIPTTCRGGAVVST